MLPDSLVSPKLWNTYSSLLEEVLLEDLVQPTSEHLENAKELKQALFENFIDVKQRNEAMFFKGLIAETSAQLVTAVSSVKVRCKQCAARCLVIDDKNSF
jgi:mediator of RNA polymerase II transcription subunit 12